MIPGFDLIPTIIGILFIVIPSMLLGRLCARVGLSEIIGFVVGGVLLGPFALGGFIPLFDRPIIQLDDLTLLLWQMSGVVILFSAGLHFTFKDLLKAGYSAAIIGTLGLIMPLALGYMISLLFGFDWIISILIGATLSATSIVISVTLLRRDWKRKNSRRKYFGKCRCFR